MAYTDYNFIRKRHQQKLNSWSWMNEKSLMIIIFIIAVVAGGYFKWLYPVLENPVQGIITTIIAISCFWIIGAGYKREGHKEGFINGYECSLEDKADGTNDNREVVDGE